MLCSYLNLPPLSHPATLELASSWLSRLSLQRSSVSHRTWPGPLQLTRPSLVTLPNSYSSLFQILAEPERSKCRNCGKRPKKPTLCLVCGRMLCLADKCCRDQSAGKGEVTRHTAECSPSNGIYLLLKESIIILVSQGLSAYNGSVYVDSYGEMDIGLIRGRPLSLDPQRMAHLDTLYARQDVINVLARNRNERDPHSVIARDAV
eukprot:gb/GEZN01011960.1/.p1 GENE.gb/GEZN01011960.1/~~gb/GEZN01011960.1/.p1  ORF type:complete len:205 (+),score=7.80 gb/GEZN01011960.1/:200-814(+)